MAAVADLEQFPNPDVVLVESGGDNLAASFSPELVDLCIYVIDVAAGTRSPAREDLESLSPICWSSTRLIWLLWWGLIWL